MAHVDDPFAMSNVLSTIGMLALIINSFVVVRFGFRRIMLMSGLVGCAFLQLIIAVVYDKDPGSKVTGKVLVALSCLYMMSYNVSVLNLPTFTCALLTPVSSQGMIAPYAWLSGGEIPSQRLRSYTFGFAAAVGFFFAWLTTFTAPYFINPSSLDWGPRYGYIWFPSALIGAVWVFFFLPELKGRTLEEIDEMVCCHPQPPCTSFYSRLLLFGSIPCVANDFPQFQAKLPARAFKSYKCVGLAAPAGDTKKSLEMEAHEMEKVA